MREILGPMRIVSPEIGWVFIGTVGVVISAFYLLRHRHADVGWLPLSTGGVPGLISGRNGFQAITNPSIEVGVDTWVALAVALTVEILGALVLAPSATSSSRVAPDSPVPNDEWPGLSIRWPRGPQREQITRRSTLPRSRSVLQRIGRDSPKSAALIH